ncbi:MAG: LacI family transcriptional regulator [Sphingomonadales bacterium]|nr:LacI family transcriptional regulator [Sphingomonadales bacterium]
MGSKPTSFDIAELAGVSQPTVSRALRGSSTVSEATRNRIMEIARQLNYKVDKNASSLRSRHANTMALLLFEDPTPDESMINPFFLAMLGSITRAASRRGYDLLVSFQQLSSDWHTDYEDSRKADGLILLGYGDYRQYAERLTLLNARGTHFVRWGSVVPGQQEVVVGCDNVAGGRQATEHLIERGRRHIGFVGEVGDGAPEFRDRHAGYRAALKGAGMVPGPHADADNSEEAGESAARALIATGAPLDAIACASDVIAIGVMRALAAAGICVPDAVAVTGFDDILAAHLVNPPLTTVLQDARAAGELLVEKLHQLVAEEPASSEMIPTRLINRAST